MIIYQPIKPDPNYEDWIMTCSSDESSMDTCLCDPSCNHKTPEEAKACPVAQARMPAAELVMEFDTTNHADAISELMPFFKYDHLPDKLQLVSKHFHDVAVQMYRTLPASHEKYAGMRKLLEAKDCFVRCKL